MSVAAGSGAAGGGGGEGADSSYAGISPSVSTTVRQELDFRARAVGEIRVVANAADYEFHYPAVEGPPGIWVHTLTAGTEQTGVVVLPAGNRLHIAASGFLLGAFGVKNALVGNVAAPLISGDPLTMASVAVVQSNPGGVAIDGTSTTGAPTVLRNVVFTSPISPAQVCAVGSIHDLTLAGSLTMEGCQIDAMTAGLTIDGTIAAARMSLTTITSMAPGAIAFTAGPTAVVSVGLAWQQSIYLTTDAGQRIVRIDPLATIPNTPVVVPTNIVGIRLGDNAIAFAGALGAVMDQTGINESDIRVIALGSLYGSSSIFLGSFSFLNAASPIVKTYAAPDTFEAIPRSNGGVGPDDAITVSQSERFDLQTPGADPPGEWYARALGPLPVKARIVYGLSLAAVSTSSTISTRVEVRSGTGGAWTPLDESTEIRIQVNNSPGFVGGHAFLAAVNSDDQFRVTIASDNAAASTEILSLSMAVEGQI
jgi:hypothetical protein